MENEELDSLCKLVQKALSTFPYEELEEKAETYDSRAPSDIFISDVNQKIMDTAQSTNPEEADTQSSEAKNSELKTEETKSSTQTTKEKQDDNAHYSLKFSISGERKGTLTEQQGTKCCNCLIF